jgi:predicted nucleic acid-binding protein
VLRFSSSEVLVSRRHEPVRELVSIDTCIWVQFFNRPQSRDKMAVDALLDDDRGASIGPIFSEILLGFRRDEHADWVASVLRGLQFPPVSWNERRAAARLGRQLVAKGRNLPLSDLVIAAAPLERNIAAFTTDSHFELTSGLNRQDP